MQKSVDKDGIVAFKLIQKKYRRRRPEVRGGALKWAEDKDTKHEVVEAATQEDQRRIDIAWAVVSRWLENYDGALQVRC